MMTNTNNTAAAPANLFGSQDARFAACLDLIIAADFHRARYFLNRLDNGCGTPSFIAGVLDALAFVNARIDARS